MRILLSLVMMVFFFGAQAVAEDERCPVWTHLEISVIGTYGGDDIHDDDLIDNETSTILKDEEGMSDSTWQVTAAVYEYKLAANPIYNGFYINTFLQPKVEHFKILTSDEYKICRGEIEDHVMQ
jgi:hypothetical protein